MRAGGKFPWWATVPVAVALAAALAGMRLPAVPEPAHLSGAALTLTLVPTEGREMLDPSSLYLAGQGRTLGRAGAARPGAPALGAEFAPVFDALVGPDLGRLTGSAGVPAGPIEGLELTDKADAPLAIGRADGNFPPLAKRLAQVEAVAAGSGRVVWSLELPPTEEADAPKGGWQPLELIGTVGPAGLSGGGLVVRISSASAKVDDYFRERLARGARVGERLPPGVYLFRVGP